MTGDITPKAFDRLTAVEKLWYEPKYRKYHTKKVRSYESCDMGFTHFMGWVEETTPIGEPYVYLKVGPSTFNVRYTMYLTRTAFIDQISRSNILMSRVLKKRES